MKLLDTNEVSSLLGINRTTLYRWCSLSDEQSPHERTMSSLVSDMLQKASPRLTPPSHADLLNQMLKNRTEETPKDFPRPFKIGRAYKWNSEEIMQWLEKNRV